MTTTLMDGYIRVSTRRGRKGPSYITKKVQRDAIVRWADYHQVTIAEWHVDEDWSGGTQQRPGLEAAIERALSGQTTGIVSWKIDRFSRFTEGALKDLRRLQDEGARLAFTQEDIDTSGPMGKFVYVIMLAMAELFLDNIKAGWIDAKTKAVARGAYITRTPFGYQREADGSIVPHPTQSQVVVDAYEAAAAVGVHSALGILRAGAPDMAWDARIVRELLARVVYLGETKHGRFEGKTHDALVDRRTWNTAQVTHATRATSAEFPLSGLTTCANCRQPMVGGHGGADGKRRTYRCASRSANRAKGRTHCDRGVVIIADRLERYVQEQAEAQLATMHVEVRDDDEEARLIQAHDDADAELAEFAADQTMRRALGSAKYEQFRDDRIAALAAAASALREYRQRQETSKTLHARDLTSLDDPQLFLTGVTALYASIIISNGRGAVASRVRLVPLDRDGTSREAAA